MQAAEYPTINETLIVCALKKGSNELHYAREYLKSTHFIKLNQYLEEGEDYRSFEKGESAIRALTYS